VNVDLEKEFEKGFIKGVCVKLTFFQSHTGFKMYN